MYRLITKGECVYVRVTQQYKYNTYNPSRWRCICTCVLKHDRIRVVLVKMMTTTTMMMLPQHSHHHRQKTTTNESERTAMIPMTMDTMKKKRRRRTIHCPHHSPYWTSLSPYHVHY